MTKLGKLTGVWLCLALTTACGASPGNSPGVEHNQQEYGEATVVAAIAVTAAIIQTARSQAPALQRPSECCAICDQCSFPCGDECVPIGAVCARAAGCACYDSQLPPEHRPAPREDACASMTPPGGPDAVFPVIVVP